MGFLPSGTNILLWTKGVQISPMTARYHISALRVRQLVSPRKLGLLGKSICLVGQTTLIDWSLSDWFGQCKTTQSNT